MKQEQEQFNRILQRLNRPVPELEQKRDRLAAELACLEEGIDALGGIEGRILRASYIEGNSWEQIGADEGYEQAQLFRLNMSAIRKLAKRRAVEQAHSEARRQKNRLTESAAFFAER